MPDVPTAALFLLTSAALLIVPGPTIALVVARSLARGRRVALPLVLGVGLGDLVAASLSLAGAGVLLAASATAFAAVKWIGALYLLWLGVRLFRAEPAPLDLDGGGDGADAARGAFRDGFLVTVFNPKGILFFVAFVPQFVDPARGYAPQAAFFVVAFTLLGMANGALYALAAARLRRLVRDVRTLRWVNRVGGTAIVGAGIAAALARRPAAV